MEIAAPEANGEEEGLSASEFYPLFLNRFQITSTSIHQPYV